MPITWRAITLANGLNLLRREIPGCQTFTLALWIPAGARTESAPHGGISHLLEHCYALGTDRLGAREIDLVAEALGGARGAATTHDCTTHFATLPSAALARWIALEANRFARLALPADEVTAEIQAVRDEADRRLSASAAGALLQRLLATAYEQHPYGRPVTGTRETLTSLPRADLAVYYRTHYVAANATFVLTGGFDARHAERLFARHFGHLPAGRRPSVTATAEPPQKSARHAALRHARAAKPQLAILWKVPPLDSPDTEPLLVLQEFVLAAVPDFSGGHWLYRDAGPLTFHATGKNAAHLRRLEARCAAVIAAISRHRPGRTELDLARRRALRKFTAALATPQDCAQLLGCFQATATTGLRRLAACLRRLPQVTAAEVQRVARQYLRPQQKTAVRLFPRPRRGKRSMSG